MVPGEGPDPAGSSAWPRRAVSTVPTGEADGQMAEEGTGLPSSLLPPAAPGRGQATWGPHGSLGSGVYPDVALSTQVKIPSKEEEADTPSPTRATFSSSLQRSSPRTISFRVSVQAPSSSSGEDEPREPASVTAQGFGTVTSKAVCVEEGWISKAVESRAGWAR